MVPNPRTRSEDFYSVRDLKCAVPPPENVPSRDAHGVLEIPDATIGSLVTHRTWISLGFALVTLLAGPPARSADSVAVEVRSGRTFAGDLDPQSDAQHLWLRTERGSAAVLRPIDWDWVVRVSIAGQELSGEDLRSLVQAIRRRVPPVGSSGVKRLSLVGKGDSPHLCEAPFGPFRQMGTVPFSAADARPALPDVRHLALDAEVGGWTDTVEPDGLILRIRPMDAAGRMIAVPGTLEVDATAQRTAIDPDPQPFFALGRWTEQVQPEDFGPGGAVYRLPFQAVHPEFDLRVAPRAAVHARLSVAGQGTFDATATDVRIRPLSIVRDHLQQTTGERFFPQERTQFGRR
jgi:hypothetical protein